MGEYSLCLRNSRKLNWTHAGSTPVSLTISIIKNMYSLQLNGFQNKEQVEAFLNWYGRQGEQQFAEELSIIADENLGEYMNVDYGKRPVWTGNVLNAELELFPFERD